MANYFAISFSIRYDDTYSERRSSLVNRMRGLDETYEDTSSFIYLKTDQDVDSVRSNIVLSDISLSKDSVVVVQCLNSTFQSIGKAESLTF